MIAKSTSPTPSAMTRVTVVSPSGVANTMSSDESLSPLHLGGSRYVSPNVEAIAMLPALPPPDTVSGRKEGKRSTSPECFIQYDRYTGSPPQTSRASASRTAAAQTSLSMLGSAVSSSIPIDFQPRSHNGLLAFPEIAWSALRAPPGKGEIAVGT